METMANGALADLGQIPPGVVMMATSVDNLRARQQELEANSREIIDAADSDERDLSEDELATIQNNRSEAARIGQQIEARESISVTNQPGQNRRTVSDAAANAGNNQQGRTVPAQVKRNDPRNGFDTFGAFAMAVRHGSIPGSQPDGRLMAAATTYGNEGTGAEGGFAVPPEFATAIMQKVMEDENLMLRCTQMTTGRNSMTFPKDETTPWQTSGGILAYWDSEAATMTQSRPSLETATMRLNKLTALVPITDELLEDAAGIESWLRVKAPAKMRAKINTAIVSGTGVGMPLGILTASNSLVTVSKESSQSADTVLFKNVNSMFSRMYAPWRRNAVWLINQDLEPQLNAMAFDWKASSGVPIYMPAGGFANSPYSTLYGRPVIPVESCSAAGDVGDIIFVDLAQYWVLTKAGGVRTDTSIHLYFDQAVTAFRFIFRMNGMPAWSTTIARENGSNTLSYAVTLEAR